jgi:uncharacterized protein (DUF4415 family)
MAAHKPRRRRGAALPPAEAPRRIPISIRIAPETLERFRATGPGWQVRMNVVLDKAAARLALAEGN